MKCSILMVFGLLLAETTHSAAHFAKSTCLQVMGSISFFAGAGSHGYYNRQTETFSSYENELKEQLKNPNHTDAAIRLNELYKTYNPSSATSYIPSVTTAILPVVFFCTLEKNPIISVIHGLIAMRASLSHAFEMQKAINHVKSLTITKQQRADYLSTINL